MLVKSLRRRMYNYTHIIHTSVAIVNVLDGARLVSGNYSEQITYNLFFCVRPIMHKSSTILVFKKISEEVKNRLHIKRSSVYKLYKSGPKYTSRDI